jgi:hypothetical protein
VSLTAFAKALDGAGIRPKRRPSPGCGSDCGLWPRLRLASGRVRGNDGRDGMTGFFKNPYSLLARRGGFPNTRHTRHTPWPTTPLAPRPQQPMLPAAAADFCASRAAREGARDACNN